MGNGNDTHGKALADRMRDQLRPLAEARRDAEDASQAATQPLLDADFDDRDSTIVNVTVDGTGRFQQGPKSDHPPSFFPLKVVATTVKVFNPPSWALGAGFLLVIYGLLRWAELVP